LVDIVKLLRCVRLTVKKVDEMQSVFDKLYGVHCTPFSIKEEINCNRKPKEIVEKLMRILCGFYIFCIA